MFENWWQFVNWLLSILANEFIALRWAWTKYDTYSDCLREFFGFTVFSLNGLTNNESSNGIGIIFLVFYYPFIEHYDVFFDFIFLFVLFVVVFFLDDFTVASLKSNDRFIFCNTEFLNGQQSLNKLDFNGFVSFDSFLIYGMIFYLFLLNELMFSLKK